MANMLALLALCGTQIFAQSWGLSAGQLIRDSEWSSHQSNGKYVCIYFRRCSDLLDCCCELSFLCVSFYHDFSDHVTWGHPTPTSTPLPSNPHQVDTTQIVISVIGATVASVVLTVSFLTSCIRLHPMEIISFAVSVGVGGMSCLRTSRRQK